LETVGHTRQILTSREAVARLFARLEAIREHVQKHRDRVAEEAVDAAKGKKRRLSPEHYAAVEELKLKGAGGK
jgi:hypothetical protein